MAQRSAITVNTAPDRQWSPVFLMSTLPERLMLLILLHKLSKQEKYITKKLHEKCIIRVVQVFKNKRFVNL